MNLEQWRRLSAIFHAVLETPAAERGAMLDQACGEDEGLRAEIEALLAADGRTATFLAPLAAAETPGRAPGPAPMPPRLAHYQIVGHVARGGMGDVYAARDLRLQRKVALKIITAPSPVREGEPALGAAGLTRFEQEARLASSLNHPNIVTVHEVGQEDGVRYIATELIEGETLRARIVPGGMALTDVLAIASQAASALAVAHAAGIVHRDIKPENVMIRNDGYVKVLDFGLAKLEPARAADERMTRPGMVMGTVGYMSPEQLRGGDVDARTDVWNLGVVLHEMVTGANPFHAATHADVIVSILEREPARLAERAAVPPRLDEIVSLCLAKDRRGRFRNAGELLAALDEVAPPAEGTGPQSWPVRAAATAGRRAARGRRHAKAVLAAGAVALAAIAFWQAARPVKDRASLSPPVMAMTPLTTHGRVRSTAVSRDGSILAYVMQEPPGQSVWVRGSAGAFERRLALSDRGCGAVAISPDNRDLYFVDQPPGESACTLFRVPLAGGTPASVLPHVDSGISFAPDGGRFAFVRVELPRKALWIAATDGSGARELAALSPPERLVDWSPAWSPDGRTIAATAERLEGSRAGLVAVDVATGRLARLGAASWRWAGNAAWRADGGALVVPVADVRDSTRAALVEISFPAGEVRPLAAEVGSYLAVASSARPGRLLAVRRDRLSSLWVTSADGGFTEATKVTAGEGRYNYNVAWTPSGEVVLSSHESGNWDLWRLDPETRRRVQLTSDPAIDREPAVSADGRYVVWESNRAGSFNVWRMDADGSRPRQLTHGQGERAPKPTADGWVVYTSWDSGEERAWKVPLEGGPPALLADARISYPVPSPDGARFVCRYRADADAPWRIALLDAAGAGRHPAILDVPRGDWQVVRWRPGTEALSFIGRRDDVDNLWQQGPDGRAQPLTRFDSLHIFSYGWSSDGRRLACVRGMETRDLVELRVPAP